MTTEYNNAKCFFLIQSPVMFPWKQMFISCLNFLSGGLTRLLSFFCILLWALRKISARIFPFVVLFEFYFEHSKLTARTHPNKNNIVQTIIASTITILQSQFVVSVATCLLALPIPPTWTHCMSHVNMTKISGTLKPSCPGDVTPQTTEWHHNTKLITKLNILLNMYYIRMIRTTKTPKIIYGKILCLFQSYLTRGGVCDPSFSPPVISKWPFLALIWGTLLPSDSIYQH